MNTLQIILIILSFVFSACTSMMVEKDHATKIKRVAIIGFDVQQQKPVETEDLFKALTHQDTSSKAELKGRMDAPHVAKMYDILVAKLESENKWSVMQQDLLKKNRAYQDFYKTKTEGWQNRPLVNDRYNLLQPEGILDSFAVMTTKPEIRKQLQQDLGVDAVLYVSIRVDLNNSSALASMVGQGTFSPSATTNLTLVNAKNDIKIWFDSSATGEKIASSDKNFMGMANQDKLNQLAIRAVESSYVTLLTNYKEKIVK